MNKKKKKDCEEEKKYVVTMYCLGRPAITVDAPKLIDAFDKIKVGSVRGRTIIKVEHDGVVRERVIVPQVIMRTFNTNGLTRTICLKNIASLFF